MLKDKRTGYTEFPRRHQISSSPDDGHGARSAGGRRRRRHGCRRSPPRRRRPAALRFRAPLLHSRSLTKGAFFFSWQLTHLVLLCVGLVVCEALTFFCGCGAGMVRSRSCCVLMRSGSGGRCRRWRLGTIGHSLLPPMRCFRFESKCRMWILICRRW